MVAASDLMRQALELVPGWSLGLVRLARFLQTAGHIHEAAEALRAALASDPSDPCGAALLLAQLGVASCPPRASPAFIAELFDGYADAFDAALVVRLSYVVPDALLSVILSSAGGGARFGAALDLGCGTGLMGERLRQHVERLAGVDLSDGMLNKARQKRLYDTLVRADITDAATWPGHRFDLVTAADVFIYLGDLAPVFAHVAACLAPNGLFGFSVETSEAADPFSLLASGRYAHSLGSIERMLRSAGLKTEASRRLAIRKDRGASVDGLIVVARAAPGDDPWRHGDRTS